mmetsp:Transcript_103272/g.182924  ORF Transcript_103272/g.182924 Transcript_103272/m.182924 type:complete len:594 (+) Transcript_103272:2-1783(+)
MMLLLRHWQSLRPCLSPLQPRAGKAGSAALASLLAFNAGQDSGRRQLLPCAAAFALTGGLLTSKSRTSPTQCRAASTSWPVASNIDDVGYITDLEGDLETFNSYLASGKSVLCRGDDGVLNLRTETAAFVFGGDLFDRGSGDLRLARELLGLKQRHPDRVFLLMGNRDVNKMRLPSELDLKYVGKGASESAFSAWWDPKAPTLSKYLASAGLPDTRMNRLQWMLRHTLGSPGAFEYRRQELADLGRTTTDAISDEQVVDSYIKSVENDDGEVRSYLRNAQIGVIIGDTLFVHGAVEERALGFVPSHYTRFKENSPEEVSSLPGVQRGLPLREWIDGLNSFACKEVAEWCKNPFWSESGTRSGEALMAYQCRPAIALMTVVVTCYVDGKNMPTRRAIDVDKMEGYQKCSDPMSSAVARYLLEGGVRRIVVGHKPSGDAPAVLRIPGPDELGFEVISADTNYATTKTKNLRGGSWCEVRVSVPSPAESSSRARLRGNLADGTGAYDFSLAALGCKLGSNADASGDSLVGRQTSDGWWVRVRLDSSMAGGQDESAAQYMLSRGSGRDAEYRFAAADEVQVEACPPALRADHPASRL